MKKALLLITITLFLFSCEKDGSSEDNNDENNPIDNPTDSDTLEDGTMSALINGELWISDSLEPASLIKYKDDWQVLTFGAKNIDYKILLSTTEPTIENCVSEKTIAGVHPLTQSENADASLFVGFGNNSYISDTFPYKETTNQNGENIFLSDLEITISNCENNKVSGKFSGTFYSVSEDEDKNVIIENGQFKNIPYTPSTNSQFSVFAN